MHPAPAHGRSAIQHGRIMVARDRMARTSHDQKRLHFLNHESRIVERYDAGAPEILQASGLPGHHFRSGFRHIALLSFFFATGCDLLGVAVTGYQNGTVETATWYQITALNGPQC